MATKTLIFKQLFEVIGHSNQVKFGDPMTEMDSRWMEISKNQTRLVDSNCCQHKASKYRQCFVKRHGSFAEALPRGNVVGRFSCELDHARRDVVSKTWSCLVTFRRLRCCSLQRLFAYFIASSCLASQRVERSMRVTSSSLAGCSVLSNEIMPSFGSL